MGGSFLSALGSWVQAVAIGWLVYDLTGSPFILGLTNFAQMAPLFFFGMLGGVLADRFDRRILLTVGLATSAVALTVLAIMTIAERASVPLIVGISLVLGLANVIVWPAWQPFIKELVPPSRLREAIAFNAARFNLSRVLGPAIGGTILAASGAGTCLAVTAVTSVAVVAVTLAVRRPRATRSTICGRNCSSRGRNHQLNTENALPIIRIASTSNRPAMRRTLRSKRMTWILASRYRGFSK